MKICKQAADFAAEHIAGRTDLLTEHDFPMDVWQKMGEAGLFQIGIDKTYGGIGGGYLTLLQAGEAFVQNGHNAGITMSWLYQQIIAHFIMTTSGLPRQRRQYLRAAAAGEIIFSFAVSEPGHGAHPKRLTTSVTKNKTGYVLSGEKTYLTNGPIADIFIIVAVTDNTPEHKRFTAFIVPRGAGGVTVLPPLNLNFLKPSPHGGVKLENCSIGKNAVLGTEGCAWTDMVVPFGEIEDVVMAGPALGGMAALLTWVVDAVRKQETSSQSALQEELGYLHARLETLRIIAYEAADRLDRTKDSPAGLVITFSHLAREFQDAIARIQEIANISTSGPYADLQRDMHSLGSLKKKLLQIRQKKIGAALIKNKL